MSIPHMGRGSRLCLSLDFDLLRDARQDVSQRPWATPTGRLTMDTYFKMHRAATYSGVKINLNPALAHRVGLHRKVRARLAGHHIRRLQEISVLEGFSGSIMPGTSIEQGPGSSASIPTLCIPSKLTHNGLSMPQEGANDLEEDHEEEEDIKVDSEEHARILEDILQVTSDI
ncbi:uncharacterized protein EDB93DRAFT_1256711 [Suillus bovinus]|uniref:uncharacterized protein n=1 Tax=Suillus bovinus TaxID=48563 RepID=UPI001B881242|nr:uncharacterized protein EDB93DRAFT_1256711 [Suillus bovinus]KAG2128328.1 hypothetical protein EDB93DRAFT_1256711 [Suillus bovinus]